MFCTSSPRHKYGNVVPTRVQLLAGNGNRAMTEPNTSVMAETMSTSNGGRSGGGRGGSSNNTIGRYDWDVALERVLVSDDVVRPRNTGKTE